jgi:thiol-disulfide isomerase/thioredoxin
MSRSLVPVLLVVCAFVVVPPLVQRLLRAELPVPELAVYESRYPLNDFAFSDDSGRSLKLADFRGTFVLLNVWASWCQPCREEMTSLDHLAQRAAIHGFKIVPISIDVAGVPTVQYFYKRFGLDNLPIYVDPSKGVMDAFGVIGIPTTILVDPDGREIARMSGGARWDAPESIAHIAEIIGRHSDTRP